MGFWEPFRRGRVTKKRGKAASPAPPPCQGPLGTPKLWRVDLSLTHPATHMIPQKLISGDPLRAGYKEPHPRHALGDPGQVAEDWIEDLGW